MKKTLKWSLVMMLAVFGLTFASCSDDDDETPTVPTVEEVVGDYSGKMTYAMAKATAEEGTALDLTVKNDSVIFEKFPYQALVKAIIPDESAAETIIEMIGDKLEYKINYTAAMNAANDSVIMTLKPEPLKIALAGVEVTIEAKTASYSIKEKDLKFNLNAANVTVGGQNFPNWNPINLSFIMKKK